MTDATDATDAADTAAADLGNERDVEVAPAIGAPRRSPGFVLAVVLCIVFGLAAAVLAVVAAGSGDDGAGQRQAVRRVAGQFGEALLTYDHADLEANKRNVLALATGNFEDEYEEAFDSSLASLIASTKSTSVATVKDVFLSEIDDATAEAIVVADLRLTGAGGDRSALNVYFQLDLVEVDGRWKVDDVVNLNFNLAGSSSGATVPSGSSPSSTSPASTSPEGTATTAG